ncbi:MAG: hypothetical protein Q4B77_05905 [Coriobacteriaceae bacterium]|nr:hypothetical protein [Coriobacteriaceae bacterium]
MNELRMYVEHLFEGRVLTPENIELKEEIYGNLVARFEDLVAEGASEDDALRQTKASISSIDDVLSDVCAGAAATSGVEDADAACEDKTAAGSADNTQSKDQETDGGDGAVSGEAGGDLGVTAPAGPTPINGPDSSTKPADGQPKAVRRMWPLALAAGAAVLLLAGIGFVGCNVLDIDDRMDRVESQQNMLVDDDPDSDDAVNSNSGNQNGKNPSVDPKRGNREIYVDESGQVWMDGEPGDELAIEVVNASHSDIAQYVETNLEDAKRVESLVRSLPLGNYVGDIDTTKAVDVLSFAYRELPDAIEGDSVDAALAYNVTAVFCAMPLVNEIQVTVTEQDDPLDESYYVFTRENVQSCYGVRLDGELVNETGWQQIKDDHLYRRKFIENMVDAAEREWK